MEVACEVTAPFELFYHVAGDIGLLLTLLSF
jgi:hypothetical protein